MTSSMRPIFKPARARARRADWAPGPGVLVRFPPVALIFTDGCHTELLCASSSIHGSKHSRIRGCFITIGLHLHATSHTGEGLASRKISDMHEGVIERGEDVGHSEIFLTLLDLLLYGSNLSDLLLFLAGALIFSVYINQ